MNTIEQRIDETLEDRNLNAIELIEALTELLSELEDSDNIDESEFLSIRDELVLQINKAYQCVCSECNGAGVAFRSFEGLDTCLTCLGSGFIK